MYSVYYDIRLLVFSLVMVKTALVFIRVAPSSVTAGANCPCPVLAIIFTADKLPPEPGSTANASRSHLRIHTKLTYARADPYKLTAAHTGRVITLVFMHE